MLDFRMKSSVTGSSRNAEVSIHRERLTIAVGGVPCLGTPADYERLKAEILKDAGITKSESCGIYWNGNALAYCPLCRLNPVVGDALKAHFEEEEMVDSEPLRYTAERIDNMFAYRDGQIIDLQDRVNTMEDRLSPPATAVEPAKPMRFKVGDRVKVRGHIAVIQDKSCVGFDWYALSDGGVGLHANDSQLEPAPASAHPWRWSSREEVEK